jgi:hypothetical protein
MGRRQGVAARHGAAAHMAEGYWLCPARGTTAPPQAPRKATSTRGSRAGIRRTPSPNAGRPVSSGGHCGRSSASSRTTEHLKVERRARWLHDAQHRNIANDSVTLAMLVDAELDAQSTVRADACGRSLLLREALEKEPTRRQVAQSMGPSHAKTALL